IEVVPLAHLARELRLVEVLREAVLEVQVEDEEQREREHERRDREGRELVRLPVAPGAEQPERADHHGEPAPQPVVPVVPPLPGELLPPHHDLGPEERRLVPRVAGAGGVGGLHGAARLAGTTRRPVRWFGAVTPSRYTMTSRWWSRRSALA